MRCRNPDCLRVMRNASDKTKETGLCGNCRKTIEKKNEGKAKIVMKPRGRGKAKISAVEKFEASLKNDAKYLEFVNMFREKPNVQTM